MKFTHKKKGGGTVLEACNTPFGIDDTDTLTITHYDCFQVNIGSGFIVYNPDDSPVFTFHLPVAEMCTLTCSYDASLTCPKKQHKETDTPPPPNTVIVTTSGGTVTGNERWGGGR